jgi:hypothetical protein
MKINKSLAFKDRANVLSPVQTKKRKRVKDRLALRNKQLSIVLVAQMPIRKKETSIMYNALLTIYTVEIEYAFSHTLIGKLPLLINFIVKVVISS